VHSCIAPFRSRAATPIRSQRNVKPDDLPNYYLMEGFKLHLSDDDTVRRRRAPEGFNYSPEQVIGHYLSFVRAELQKQLESTYGRAINEYSLKYCLTIPAGWSEKAKLSMRT
jgi:hypothetical protein